MTDLTARAQALLSHLGDITDLAAVERLIIANVRHESAQAVCAVLDHAPAIVRDLLAALVEANAEAQTWFRTADRLATDADAAEQRATKAEAEIARLTAPVPYGPGVDPITDALGCLAAWPDMPSLGSPELDRAVFDGAVRRLRMEVEKLRAPVGEGLADRLLGVVFAFGPGDSRRNAVRLLADDVRAIEGDAARWHAARIILDGAREAHEKMTPGEWSVRLWSVRVAPECDDMEPMADILAPSDPDDRRPVRNVASVHENGRDPDAQEANARGIVADHAAVDELLRLARGES